MVAFRAPILLTASPISTSEKGAKNLLLFPGLTSEGTWFQNQELSTITCISANQELSKHNASQAYHKTFSHNHYQKQFRMGSWIEDLKQRYSYKVKSWASKPLQNDVFIIPISTSLKSGGIMYHSRQCRWQTDHSGSEGHARRVSSNWRVNIGQLLLFNWGHLWCIVKHFTITPGIKYHL